MIMNRQYVIRTRNYAEEIIPEAVLDPRDPIHELKIMAGIGNAGTLKEYSGYGSMQGNGATTAANEKIQYQQENNILPGSSEWFRLWFEKNTSPS